MVAQDAVCRVWAHYDGEQHCSPSLERAQQPVDSGRDQCVSWNFIELGLYMKLVSSQGY